MSDVQPLRTTRDLAHNAHRVHSLPNHGDNRPTERYFLRLPEMTSDFKRIIGRRTFPFFLYDSMVFSPASRATPDQVYSVSR